MNDQAYLVTDVEFKPPLRTTAGTVIYRVRSSGAFRKVRSHLEEQYLMEDTRFNSVISNAVFNARGGEYSRSVAKRVPSFTLPAPSNDQPSSKVIRMCMDKLREAHSDKPTAIPIKEGERFLALNYKKGQFLPHGLEPVFSAPKFSEDVGNKQLNIRGWSLTKKMCEGEYFYRLEFIRIYSTSVALESLFRGTGQDPLAQVIASNLMHSLRLAFVNWCGAKFHLR